MRRTERADDVVADACDTVAAALGPPGQVATLILPADASWLEVAGDAADPGRGRPAGSAAPVDADRVETAAKVLRSGEPAALFVGGRVVRGQALRDAGRRQRRHRRPAAVRDLPGPPRAGRRACRRSSGWATWPSSPPPSSTAWPT